MAIFSINILLAHLVAAPLPYRPEVLECTRGLALLDLGDLEIEAGQTVYILRGDQFVSEAYIQSRFMRLAHAYLGPFGHAVLSGDLVSIPGAKTYDFRIRFSTELADYPAISFPWKSVPRTYYDSGCMIPGSLMTPYPRVQNRSSFESITFNAARPITINELRAQSLMNTHFSHGDCLGLGKDWPIANWLANNGWSLEIVDWPTFKASR